MDFLLSLFSAQPQVSAGLGLSNVQMPFKSPSELQPGLVSVFAFPVGVALCCYGVNVS